MDLSKTDTREYILRPEAAEGWWYMYELTRDDKYVLLEFIHFAPSQICHFCAAHIRYFAFLAASQRYLHLSLNIIFDMIMKYAHPNITGSHKPLWLEQVS